MRVKKLWIEVACVQKLRFKINGYIFARNMKRYKAFYHTEQIIRAIQRLPKFENILLKYIYLDVRPGDDHLVSEIEIAGWSDPETRSHLNLKNLSKLNPDATNITIIKSAREDVALVHGKSFRNSGFKITFIIPRGKQISLIDSSTKIYPQSSNNHAIKMIESGSKIQLIHDLNRPQSINFFLIDVVASNSDLYFKFGNNAKLLNCARTFIKGNSDDLLLALKYNHNPQLALLLAGLSAREVRAKFLLLAENREYFEREGLEPWNLFKVERMYLNPQATSMNSDVLSYPDFFYLGNRLRIARPTHKGVRPADLGIFALYDVSLQSGGTILTKDCLHVVDRAADPRHEFISGQHDHIFGSATFAEDVIVKRSKSTGKSFGETILLAGRNDSNYYHWMIEVLPRAIELDQTFDRSIPFLVSTRTPKNGLEALKLLSNRWIISVDAGRLNHFEILHVSTPSATILDSTITDWHNTIRMDYDTITQMRKQFISTIDKRLFNPRVYLARTSGIRRLVNQDEIQASAVKLGFDVFYPEQMTFMQQLNLFHHAEVIVGPTGAVMANYIFMNKGAKILGLTSRLNATSALPALMGAISGADYFSLQGIDTEKKRLATDNLHNDFKINRRDFERALSKIDH
jgi:hypothetical protein